MNNLGWAGAETQLYHLAAGLSEAGQSLTLLAIGGIHIDVQPLTEAESRWWLSVRPVEWRRSERRSTSRGMRDALMLFTARVTDASLWGRIGAVLARRPVVVTEHSGGGRTCPGHRTRSVAGEDDCTAQSRIGPRYLCDHCSGNSPNRTARIRGRTAEGNCSYSQRSPGGATTGKGRQVPQGRSSASLTTQRWLYRWRAPRPRKS